MEALVVLFLSLLSHLKEATPLHQAVQRSPNGLWLGRWIKAA